MKRSAITTAIFAIAACSADQAMADPQPTKAVAKIVSPSGKQEVAIVAGGCFWGMEHVMRKAPGILSIEVGYAGGKSDKVSYEQVSEGDTGHAESVRIVF